MAVKELDKNFGVRLKAVCKQVGGQKTLAKAIGVSENQISRYISMTSAPSLLVMVKIADFTGVPLEVLATGEPRQVDVELFEAISEKINKELKALKIKIEPVGLAELTAIFYNSEISLAHKENRQPEVKDDNVVQFLDYYVGIKKNGSTKRARTAHS